MTQQPLRLTAEQRSLLDRLLDEDGVGSRVAEVRRWTGDRAHAPLSFAQQRLYFVDGLRPGTPNYLVAGVLRLRGELDVDSLVRAVRLLVYRHEALRTAIVPGADGPEQRVQPSLLCPVDIPVREIGRADVDEHVALFARTGFDLAEPPLFRLELLRVREHGPDPDAAPDWVLAVCVHHIVVDGWSLGVLLRELGEAYQAFSRGGRPRLADLPVQYVDFAVWQREHLRGDVLARQLAFWRAELDQLPTAQMATDRPRPAERTYAGDFIRFGVGDATLDRLNALAQSTRSTLFMVLVAAVSVVVGRWTGERDVLLGSPVAGRPQAELDGVIGMFVNTVPLRLRFDERQSFRTMLAAVQRVCTAAYAHHDLPYERIVQEIAPDRDVSGQTPLARYWIVLHNTPTLGFSALDLAAEFEPVLGDTVRCDVSFQFVLANGALTGRVEYSTELFTQDTTCRLVSAVETVLAAVAGDPDCAVAAVPVLPDGARAELLERFSGAGSPPVTGTNPAHAFEAHADRAPDAVAVVAGAARVTYRDLDGLANRVAEGLRTHGIGPEGRVGIMTEAAGPVRIAAVLGVLKAGAACFMLDPGHPPARIATLVATGAPGLVLADPGVVDRLQPGSPVAELPSVLARPPAPRTAPAPNRPDTIAYLLFTSGSTGLPKGVLGTYGGLVNRLDGMQRAYRLQPADRVLCKAAATFDVSLWEMLWPLTVGATVVCAGPDGHRDVEHLHELIDREAVTVAHFVPSLLQAFVDGPGHDSLRVLFSGGEELPAALAEQVLERFPAAALYNQYGPTETAIDVTATRVTRPVANPVPIGRPVPGVEIYVLDELLRPQPVGVPGELFVGGIAVARGYMDDPRRTAERFLPHPFRPVQRLYATGDRVRWLADGNLEFLGRTDRQLKIRGNRVEPGDVEAAILAYPAVTRAYVTSHVDRDEPELVGYYSGNVPGLALRQFLAGRLPEPMVPTHLVAVTEWPSGSHGKIDTSALPAPDGALPADPAYVAPRTATEGILAEIFADLLGRDRISVADSFLALGGHSLMAIKAISRIRARLGAAVRLGQFFQTPTVAGLAALIDQHDDTTAPAEASPLVRVERRPHA